MGPGFRVRVWGICIGGLGGLFVCTCSVEILESSSNSWELSKQSQEPFAETASNDHCSEDRGTMPNKPRATPTYVGLKLTQSLGQGFRSYVPSKLTLNQVRSSEEAPG